MVGVPKSRGCSTCRARSIKCDEAKPSCSQCRRGGRKCPGYQKRWKFIDECEKLRGKVGREPLVFPTEPNLRPPNTPKLSFLRPGHRSLDQAGIVAAFVQDLFPLGSLTVQHSFIGSWLWQIPAVLHKSRAMDLAAESLALAYFAKKDGSTDTLIRSYNIYTIALSYLSIAIQDHRSRLASETLSATLLLVHFESFVAMRSKSWVTHTCGAGRLIQLRGPDRHRSGFECSMFMACRGYLISQAIETGNQCFLDEDEWRDVQVDYKSLPLMPVNCAVCHDALNCFAKFPGLIGKFRSLENSSSPTHRARIHFEAKNARSNIMEWFRKLQSEPGPPIQILLPLPFSVDMIYTTAYEYRDIITAAFVVNYCAYLIQVNNILDSLENTNGRLELNVVLSEKICMSAAYCSRAGFCGAQAMAFALPFALSALPESHTPWIQHQINIFDSCRKSSALRPTLIDEKDLTYKRSSAHS